MDSKSKMETEVVVDATTVVERVPVCRPVVNLSTLENYKDRKSIAEALMDDDFSSPVLAKIAEAIQQEDPKERKRALLFMQYKSCYLDLKRVQQALDDKGYMYDTKNQIIGWKDARALARCFARRIKTPDKKDNKEKKTTEPKGKTSAHFLRTQGRSF